LGYTVKNPTNNVVSIAYISPRKLVSHSGSATSTGTYGPTVSGVALGATLSPMTLRAQYPSAVTLNSGDNVGGAFLYFSEWDYFGSSTITGWTNGPCYVLSYLLYSTNYDLFLTGSAFTYTYKNMKGVVCFTDTGNSVSGASLSVSSSVLPTKWGLNLPGNGAYSQNTGNLLTVAGNTAPLPSSLQVTNVASILTPVMGPMLINSVGNWTIPLPVALVDNVQIVMTGDSSANLPFTSSAGTCCIYV
jgi:hypothetical protein